MKKPKFVMLKFYQNKNNKQRTMCLSVHNIKSMGKKLPKNKMVKVTW